MNQANAVPSHPLGALSYEYSGNINTLSIGNSLRTGKDRIPNPAIEVRGIVPCDVAVSSSSVLGEAIRNPANTAIVGLPVGATIIAAHLYWVGSYDPVVVQPEWNGVVFAPPAAPSNSTAPDFNVIFNGTPVTSSKNMTDIYPLAAVQFTATGGAYSFPFFGGYADVTSIVAATGNGTYTLSGLTVNTRGYHCTFYAVVAGWALHVVYEEPTEPFRIVKIYDGFDIYRGESILITPTGFTVPAVPQGKAVVTTWEGDESNSGASGFFSEGLKINVLPSFIPNFDLIGPLNPLVDAASGLPNQFNGTRNTTTPTFPLIIPSSTTHVGAPPAPWGVDIDHYNLTAQLTAGQTSLTTEYSSGADLVILSSEIIVIENDLFADLAITKTHAGDFGAGVDHDYTITVNNNGPIAETGPINVVDTLPVGMNYVAVSGVGWTCSVAGSIISCSHVGPLANAASLPPITLTVNVPTVTPPTLTNTVTVSGALTDDITLNNTATDLTNIAPPILTVLKSAGVASANPGDVINYTVQVNNTGLGVATAVSQDDRLSRYTSFGVDCMPATVLQPTPHSITFTEGTPASTLTLGALTFSDDGGTFFTYNPPALGGGVCTFDPTITHFRQAMTGTMPASGQYFLTYQTQVK
ncbi:DUF11 domain-containing protein [bacterium AH-315-I20]|nr:DUF11 domain-containing protein [bacterium AH-315-I20]